jgi:hypothetical protein
MLDLLSQYSRDVWHLAFCGYAGRLREVLRADPDLAKQVTRFDDWAAFVKAI